jgi:hypothetical protein
MAQTQGSVHHDGEEGMHGTDVVQHVVVLQRNAHQHHQEVQPPHHLAEPACDTRPWQLLRATKDPGRTCMRDKTLAEPACGTRLWQNLHATQDPGRTCMTLHSTLQPQEAPIMIATGTRLFFCCSHFASVVLCCREKGRLVQAKSWNTEGCKTEGP